MRADRCFVEGQFSRRRELEAAEILLSDYPRQSEPDAMTMARPVPRMPRAPESSGRLSRLLLPLLLLLIPAAGGAQEQEPPPGVDKLLSAVVGVRARVPADARTAAALGTERTGSGVVIDANGLIVTIGYLILEATRVEVLAGEGRLLPAEILAYDHETGFGLLRASEPVDVAPMTLGDSSRLGKGDQLLVSSFGGRLAARPAVLVSRRDFAGYWEYLLEDAIFTAPPYPLFGGAALVDSAGELVGIGSLVVPDAYPGDEPLAGNMFVPVDRLKGVLGDLLTAGRSPALRPWLGVYLSEVDSLLIVQRLAADGPAAGAGVQPGDIILGVGGQPVASMADFYRKLWAVGAPGDKVPLTILKGAQMHEVSVTSRDRYDWLRLE